MSQSITEELVEALESLVGGCLSYQGNSIVITCDSHGWALKKVHEARSVLTKYREAAVGDEAGERAPIKPRLTDAIIEAAMIAHYGERSRAIGIDGLDLTSNGRNWTFREGFARMWHGAWSAMSKAPPLPSSLDEQGARELLADTWGIPLKSDSDIDLSDKDCVPISHALRAIQKASRNEA